MADPARPGQLRATNALPDAADDLGGGAFADYIGLRHQGAGVTTLKVRSDLLNGMGRLLGPVGFALVDYSMAFALWEYRNPGEVLATVSVALNFVQSVTDGEVVCTSTVDRRNRYAAVLSSRVVHEDGRLLITAVGSFTIHQPKER
jgi:uncharacterized protein (TIGR00369 family)